MIHRTGIIERLWALFLSLETALWALWPGFGDTESVKIHLHYKAFGVLDFECRNEEGIFVSGFEEGMDCLKQGSLCAVNNKGSRSTF